jgi:hypothetical protein
MGNTISTEELSQRRSIMQALLAQPFPTLDIGQRMGATGYIDVIKASEMTAPVMKGRDYVRRPFLCVRADILCSDGGAVIPTFATFFQRYTDGDLWMACGNLISTIGGMNTVQMTFIQQLIDTKEVVVADMDVPRLCFNHHEVQESFDDQTVPRRPVKVTLAATIIPSVVENAETPSGDSDNFETNTLDTTV